MDQAVPDKSPLIVAVGIFLIIVPTLAVVLRFVSRYLSKAGIWWDDWVILLALPFSLALEAEILYGVHHGFGKHAVDGPPDATTVFFKLLYGGELLYNSCVALCKISLLLFYYRMFGPVRSFRIALGAVAVLVACWFLSMSFAAIFACSPIQSAWDPTIPGHCTNLEAYFIGQAVPNVITDFILLLLPVPMLWKLRIARPQRIALLGVFVLGYFVPVISLLRLICAVQLGDKSHEDVTWNVVTLYLWSCTEPAIGIVSTCIPSISYLFKRTIKFFSPSGKTESHGYGISHSSDHTVGHSGSGKQRYKFTGSSDFIKLRDVPSTTTTAVPDYPISSARNDYTVAIHGQDAGDVPKYMGMDNKESVVLPQQIHVRRDLDQTYEQQV